MTWLRKTWILITKSDTGGYPLKVHGGIGNNIVISIHDQHIVLNKKEWDQLVNEVNASVQS
jgi:hypothetical protein